MLTVSTNVRLPDSEVEVTSIRASGPGGQNVNKVASAIHLRFDIHASSLPEEIKNRLLDCRDYRINREGILVIKAQRYRTREQNLEDARSRLVDLITSVLVRPKARRKTRPSRAAKQKRLQQKSKRAGTKRLRGRVSSDE